MNELFADIPQLGHTLTQYFILLSLCSLRLMIVMIIFPPTADSVLQGVVRNALVLLWSTFVAFGQQGLAPQLRGEFLLLISLKEAVIGLVIAYLASSAFWVIDAVGAYVDNLTGYNNVQPQQRQGNQPDLHTHESMRDRRLLELGRHDVSTECDLHLLQLVAACKHDADARQCSGNICHASNGFDYANDRQAGGADGDRFAIRRSRYRLGLQDGAKT